MSAYDKPYNDERNQLLAQFTARGADRRFSRERIPLTQSTMPNLP